MAESFKYRRAENRLVDFTPQEISFLRSLNTPRKIQDFLDRLPTNREPEGDTCLSPLRVLRENRAHCIEAAMLAAFILRLNGHKPLLLDLTANNRDQDHVLALFRVDGCLGAIAKSNHYCNGYRDPVYRTVRELVMSYFHEYLNLDGEKTLRSFSRPFDLTKLDKQRWATAQEDVWFVPEALIKTPHTPILTAKQARRLRAADPFVREVNNLQREPQQPYAFRWPPTKEP